MRRRWEKSGRAWTGWKSGIGQQERKKSRRKLPMISLRGEQAKSTAGVGKITKSGFMRRIVIPGFWYLLCLESRRYACLVAA
jgi:hypothetical protein